MQQDRSGGRRGALYVATGAEHVAEATASAIRLREVAPKLPISLIASMAPADGHPFEAVTLRAPAAPGMINGFRFVIDALVEGLPYGKTLFLDTDTWAIDNPNQLFGLTRFADCAAALEPNGHFEGVPTIDERPVRGAPRFNTGVVLFRRGEPTSRLLREWQDRFHAKFGSAQDERDHPEQMFETDQRTFAEAVLASGCRMMTLESNWNLRTPFYSTVSGRVHLLHGRHHDPSVVADLLNASPLNRSWDPFEGCVHLLDPARVVAHGFHLHANDLSPDSKDSASGTSTADSDSETVDRSYEIADRTIPFRTPGTPGGQLTSHLVLSGQSYPLFELTAERPVIVDIGANVGAASTWFALNHPTSTIHAVEPSSRCWSLLDHNLSALADLETPITTHRVALSDFSGPAPLFPGTDDDATGSLRTSTQTSDDGQMVEVRHTGEWLDDVGLARIDLLKVDTEGSEVDILKAIPQETIVAVEVIHIEFHRRGDRNVIDELLASSHLLFHANIFEVDLGELTYLRRDHPRLVQSGVAEDIAKVVSKVSENRRTMVSPKRLANLARHCTDRRGTGAFVECGVARGGCLAVMAHVSAGASPVWGFDSFQGMPELSAEDADDGASWVGWRAAERAEVDTTFEMLDIDTEHVSVVAGWFEDTLAPTAAAIGAIAVLRLDNDWYRSTRFCLETLYGQMIPGGVVIIDDYHQFVGCRQAVDEFRSERSITAPMIETEAGSEAFWIVPG